jgi:hypothetical protein
MTTSKKVQTFFLQHSTHVVMVLHVYRKRKKNIYWQKERKEKFKKHKFCANFTIIVKSMAMKIDNDAKDTYVEVRTCIHLA